MGREVHSSGAARRTVGSELRHLLGGGSHEKPTCVRCRDLDTNGKLAWKVG